MLRIWTNDINIHPSEQLSWSLGSLGFPVTSHSLERVNVDDFAESFLTNKKILQSPIYGGSLNIKDNVFRF